MNGEARKRCIVVLGMHRSGSSTLTRGLTVMGVELGETLAPGDASNRKGYWEDTDVNEICEAVLTSIGHVWHSTTLVTRGNLDVPQVIALKRTAIDLIRQKSRNTAIFGLKNPRLAKLLPFWHDVFASLELDVSYVIPTRHPISVAQSLRDRDGFEPEKSHYLWLDHMVRSMCGSAGSCRVVVDYDRLLDHPIVELRRIADCLDLSLDPEKFQEYEKDFLDATLRHSRFQRDAMRLDPAVPKPVAEAYGLLEALSADRLTADSETVKTAFLGLARQLDELAPALRYMSTLDGAVSSLEERVVARDARIAHHERGIAEREAQIAHRETVIAECDTQIAHQHEVIAERDAQIAQRETVIAEREAQIAHRETVIAEREADISSLRQELIERELAIALLKGTIDEERERTANLWNEVLAHNQELLQRCASLKYAMIDFSCRLTRQDRKLPMRVLLPEKTKRRLSNASTESWTADWTDRAKSILAKP